LVFSLMGKTWLSLTLAKLRYKGARF
jgi:hypothetical protein